MGNIMEKDGFWSWVVLLATCCSQIILGGITLNGGLFYIIFRNAFEMSSIEASWLCSLPTALWFLATPIGSALTNRYGYRTCAFLGGLVATTGISLGYFATSPAFLFISHGLLTGLGFGISHTGFLSAVNVYFEKYRTIALGLASIGNNVGLVIYAQLLTALDSSYGWRGMMLIIGAISSHFCVFAACMIPLKVNNTHSNVHSGDLDIQAPKRKTLNFGVFRKLSFVCFCASNVFVNISFGIYYLHLPSYSREASFDDEDIGTMWLVNGISNIIGKVFFSLLGHHPKVNTTVLYAITLALTGIFTGALPAYLTKLGILITASACGFFSCTTGALLQSVIFNIVGYDRFADGTGMSLPFKAFGNLIGGPLAGVLLSMTGSYNTSFYLAGVCMVLAALLLLYPIYYHLRKSKSERRDGIDQIVEKEIPDEPSVFEKESVKFIKQEG